MLERDAFRQAILKRVAALGIVKKVGAEQPTIFDDSNVSNVQGRGNTIRGDHQRSDAEPPDIGEG